MPMMITITFNGAVNDENVRIYDKLFHSKTNGNMYRTTQVSG